MAVELVPYVWDDMDLGLDPLHKVPAAETIKFAFDGSGDREIDLSAEHVAALRKFMAAYLAASRPVREALRSPTRKFRTGTREEYNTALRAWAAGQGITVEAYESPDGKKSGYKYPVGLRRKYEAFLAEQHDTAMGTVH